VEKPLCLKPEELDEITAAYQELVEKKKSPVLMVGFNRRFAPLAAQMKAALGSGAMSMLYRINAGSIPADSWIQDAEIGGGRIVGEVCHFIDFMTYLNGSMPLKVYAVAMSDPANLSDTISINLGFENGSVGAISYFANGSKSLAKEYVEAYRGGRTAVMTDFKELKIYGKGKPTSKKLLNQDKGQKLMVHAFLEAARGNAEVPIAFAETWAATKATFSILESLKTGEAVSVTST
jgi:predicted dehydrogenase